MKEKVLVLGGKGFIGEYLVAKMSKLDKYEIIVADRKIDRKMVSNDVTFLPLEFSEKTDFSKYLKDINTVIHLISTIFPDEDTDYIEKSIIDNIFPTLSLLRSMVKANCKKIVFASSGGTIYGNHNNVPIPEKDVGYPISNYGIVKDMIEKYIFLFSYYYGLDYRIIRLSNPYGGRSIIGRKQGLIPILIEKIKKGDTIQIWGNGNNIRDYIYINDVIEAIIRIMEYSGSQKIFNVGTGIGYSINDIIKILCSHMDENIPNIEYTVPRKCDVNNNILDITYLKNLLKFKPKYSLEDGITEILHDYNKK